MCRSFDEFLFLQGVVCFLFFSRIVVLRYVLSVGEWLASATRAMARHAAYISANFRLSPLVSL
jgi:hypothetical protein